MFGSQDGVGTPFFPTQILCFETCQFLGHDQWLFCGPSAGAQLLGGFGSGTFNNISMGQGQEMVAINAVNKAARDGHWVVLQNIHLMQASGWHFG